MRNTMIHAATALHRLRAQSLTGAPNASPLATVRRLGALQAQDYGQSLWAIGARTPNVTAAQIEQAVRDRQILRTWTMRGTIHFVPACDAQWIVSLCATRQISAAALRHRQLDLDAATLARAGDLFREHLQQPMARPDIFELLQRNGIATNGQRGYHILVHLAQSGLIALGPMSGKQPTAVLLDTWVRDAVKLAPEAALAEFARRYFTSHGPATIQDFAHWTGLTLSDARRAHAAIRSSLLEEAINGLPHWSHASQTSTAADVAAGRLLLLPGYDEFLLGYKDRRAVLPEAHAEKIALSNNGIFRPMIVERGEITGTWSRTIRAAGVELILGFFSPARRRAKRDIDAACERFATFLGTPLKSRAFA